MCAWVGSLVACLGPLCGERPVPVVVVESEVDESSQVDGSDPGSEGGVVAGDAAVADSAVTVGDEPGDGAFDHGSPAAVVSGEVSVSPGSPDQDATRWR